MTRDIRDFIRTIPDFPHKGILFRDVTTLFGDPEGMRLSVDRIVGACQGKQIDKVAGLEARGFILGGAVAHQLGLGFVPIRKSGKLPGPTIAEHYALEYGSATMELHDDALQAGERVLLVDDLIATGGTAAAGIKLVERLGGQVVQASFIIDLPDLKGREVVEKMGVPVQVLCAFEGL